MKKRVGGILAILCVSVGCTPQKIELGKSSDISKVLIQLNEQKESKQPSASYFMEFFKAYFSFSEEELSSLNQRQAQVDEHYWSHLRQDYKPLIKAKLGDFLSEELLQKLETQYLWDEVTLPKWVLLNEYKVLGEAQVEALEIQSTREFGMDSIYEIALITTHTCYPVDRSNPTSELDTKEKDELKLKQLFWVTVSKESPFKIKSIHPAQVSPPDVSDDKIFLDSNYITRMPYKEEVSQEDKELLNKFFEALMTRDRDFYKYYEKTYYTSASAFQRMWGDMELENEVTIEEAHYRENFPISIIPYKDEMSLIAIQKDNIQFKPSVYSTKQRSRYVVTVPVEALLNNNQKVYYNYKYFVGIESQKIEFIQFMSIKEMQSEDHTGK